MNTQTQSIATFVEFPHVTNPALLPGHGPVQLLIVDRANGPADMVFDVFSRLFEFGVEFNLASTPEGVLSALNYNKIDLLVIGLEDRILEALALVPSIRK